MLQWIEQHAGLAGWVQGVGTLVALGLTVWSTMHASAVSTRLALRQTNAILDHVEGILQGLSNSLLIGFPDSVASARELVDAYDDIGTNSELDRLLEMPLTAWPDLTLCAAVGDVKKRAWLYRRDVDMAIQRAKQTRGGEPVQEWPALLGSLVPSRTNLDGAVSWLATCAADTAFAVGAMSRRKAERRFRTAYRPNLHIVKAGATER